MASLHPCPSCARHVRPTASVSACPFCGAEVAPRPAADARPLLSRPRTRAALLFAGAAVVGACSSTAATPAYGVPATDAGLEDAGEDAVPGPVAMYGPAPVPDSGRDAAETGPDAADASDGSDDSG
ncbi:MAG: hypothetical protein JST00_20940 [Deltaproteobacteria bacterium]|nr:hypothetical protein [Deltaproteobacteria bacterium]